MVRLLSWNLFHGRDAPPDRRLFTWRSRLLRTTERNATHVQVNRSLRREFAEVVAREAWDVALLQEAPPRWLGALAGAAGAQAVHVLTSRNWLAPVSGWLAEWNPDLIGSAEGGSNAILARPPWRIAATRSLRLALLPERRRMLWALLEHPEEGMHAVANIHASAGLPRRAARELENAAAAAVAWSGAVPLVLGGDLNLRPRSSPEPFAILRERFGLGCPIAPGAIDHLLARGLDVVEPPRALPPERRELPAPDGRALRLSDHAPVVAAYARSMR